MFAIVSALVFGTAFTLAMTVMAYMFSAYHDKMIAALLYQPETAAGAPACRVAVTRMSGRAANRTTAFTPANTRSVRSTRAIAA